MSSGFNEAFTPKGDDMGPFYRHIEDSHLNPHPQYATDTDLSAHAAAADPHTGYVLDATLTAHEAAANPHPVYALDTDLTTHAGAADPHTGYRLESALIQRADIAGDQRETSTSDRAIPSTTRSTTSTSAVNWPVTDILERSVTKNGASGDSSLLVMVFGSCYHDTSGGIIIFGVRANSTDYLNNVFYFNDASKHHSMMGYERITGLAAGTYTVTCRAYTNTGTLSIDNNDRWQLIVREVPA